MIRMKSSLKRTAVVFDAACVPLENGLRFVAAEGGPRVDGLGTLLQQAGYGSRKWFVATAVVTPELRALIGADLEATSPRR